MNHSREIMISESQERMVTVVRPAFLDAVAEVCPGLRMRRRGSAQRRNSTHSASPIDRHRCPLARPEPIA
jgi:hypothetical protein